MIDFICVCFNLNLNRGTKCIHGIGDLLFMSQLKLAKKYHSIHMYVHTPIPWMAFGNTFNGIHVLLSGIHRKGTPACRNTNWLARASIQGIITCSSMVAQAHVPMDGYIQEHKSATTSILDQRGHRLLEINSKQVHQAPRNIIYSLQDKMRSVKRTLLHT